MDDHHPDAIFTMPEIERACGLPPRGFEMLKREGLLPASLTKPGRGKLAIFDMKALGAFSTISALDKGLQNLSFAARLAADIHYPLHAKHGVLPFGTEDWHRALPTRPEFRDSNGEIIHFCVFKAAREARLVSPNKAMDSDYRLAIADNEIIFQARGERLSFVPTSEEDEGSFSPIFWLRSKPGRREGFNIDIIDGTDEAIDRHALSRLKNAVSITQINLSLAMRNILFEIADERAMRNKK